MNASRNRPAGSLRSATSTPSRVILNVLALRRTTSKTIVLVLSVAVLVIVIEFPWPTSGAGSSDKLGIGTRPGKVSDITDDCLSSKGVRMPNNFDHDKLDVYRVTIEYVADSFAIAKDLSGVHRHARDQWLRAAQSIPLNIAEGNGKRSTKDRARYFDIARGSAMQCAAIQDVLVVSQEIDTPASDGLKTKLKRIVSMLTRLTLRAQDISEGAALSGIDYEHEHRCAEHE